MARPRIFVSSTYYDLKYIRASLDLFIKSLGFDPILSEKGDIAYTSDRPLDESCYREVENSDVFVLIVGGRYGSEASAGSKQPKDFFDRYESITKKEYESAVEREIPVYVLIEKSVYAEYQTFVRNKSAKGINYAYVDSVNVFLLIEDILAKPRNNPVQPFEKFEDIEAWLREQWSGLFRELLRRQSQQQQLAGLSQQVLQLKETNETLKKYLEAVMRGAGKQATSKLIKSEERRLSEVRRAQLFRGNQWVKYVFTTLPEIRPEAVVDAVRNASGFADFVARLRVEPSRRRAAGELLSTLRVSEAARRDLNEARALFDLPLFETPDEWEEEATVDRPSAEPDEASSKEPPAPAPVPSREKPRRASKKGPRKKRSPK
jgi:hypothetical protein